MLYSIDKALAKTSEFGTRECAAFRERIFSCHEYIAEALANHYVRIANKSSYVEANRELRKLHKLLTLGKAYHGLYIDSPDEDIKRFAEQHSIGLLKTFTAYNNKYGHQRAIEHVIKKLDECDLTFPLDDPLNASKEAVAAALARCFDSLWWRRKIRKRQDIILEHVHIKIGRVNKKAGIYASNHCLQRKTAQWKRNEQILAGLIAENDLGEVFTLADIAKCSISNLTNRRNELMTRMSGVEGVANSRGDVGIFLTITAPSKYHSFLSKPCKPNPKYTDFSPADTQKYFNKVWQRIRAKWKRLNIHPYGFRVVEPHHDGTPHWHILLFAPKEQCPQIEAITKHYALEEDTNEAGAQKNRVKVEYIDPKKGSATGYIAKYIAKNIDGKDVGEDLYGFDAIDSATRIRAWASNWNIRQFQSIGGPSVTVWREARKFANQELAKEILETIGDDKLQQIIEAADKGDWQAFVELSGGPIIPRKEQLLRAMHVRADKPNKYGEITQKILGILYKGAQKIVTRIRQWTISPLGFSKSSPDFNTGFSTGGANAPPLEFCQ